MSAEFILEWEYDQFASKWKAKSVAAFRHAPLTPLWWTIEVTKGGMFVVSGSSALLGKFLDYPEGKTAYATFNMAKDFCERVELELDSVLTRAADFYVRLPRPATGASAATGPTT